MKALVKKFYDEPVFCLAVVQAAAVAVAAKVQSTAVVIGAFVVIGVCEAAKRQLVEPYYE